MKKAKFLFFIVLLIFFIPFHVYAKDYNLKEAKVYYFIQNDGEIKVINDISYKFSGSFSEAWLTIPVGDYEIKDPSVSEIKDGREVPLKFEFTKDKKEYRITWNYKANNDIKTFRIEYKISKGLKVYEDVAEFYWKVWGGGWDKSLPALWAEVNLPRKIDNLNDINYWLHPKIDGKIGIKNDQSGIIAYAGNIPSKQWVEVRVVFPKNYLTNLKPDNVKLISKNGRNMILDEEEAWEKNQEQKETLERNLEKIYLILSLIFLGLAVSIATKIKQKYGKEPEVFYEGIYEREVPCDCPPAWLEILLNKLEEYISSDSIIASTLELARRGYLKIKEEKNKKTFGFKLEYKILLTDKKVDETLSEDLKALLFEYKSYGDEFYLSDIDKKKFSEFVTKFKKIVTEKVYNENKWIIVEKYKEVSKYVYLWLIMALLSFASIIVSAILHFNVSLVILNMLLIIISVSAFIHASLYKFGIKKYSYEGKLLTLKWNAFKKFLKDFSLISQYPPASLVIWEKYLVYGTALGIAKEVLKAMKELNAPFEKIDWYIPAFIGEMNINNFAESFNTSLMAFSQNFSQNVISSSSSASSHGGGGGFGGGGGGAR
ncbi:MAG: DUF2207 family protein [Minisyncoccia bacterium]